MTEWFDTSLFERDDFNPNPGDFTLYISTSLSWKASPIVSQHENTSHAIEIFPAKK